MQSESFRGVDFPAMLLSPLPQEEWPASCVECDRPQARWDLQAVQGLAPVCSLCVLYVVPWLGKSGEDIARLVELVAEAGCEFPSKDEQGRLLSCGYADRIVSSLVLTSKVLGMARRPR